MNELDTSVARHMHAPVQTVCDTDQLAVAARVMDELGVSALPVVDSSNRLTGVLERSQLVRAGRFRGPDASGTPILSLPEGSVAEHMQNSVPVIAPVRSLRECARRMLERQLYRVFVVADNEVIGVVGMREILLAVASERLDVPLAELANGVAPVVSSTAPVSEASARCAQAPGALSVVLDGSSPVGVFSLGALDVGLHSHPRDATGLWMDRAVLELPADTPAHVAAQRALEAGARYLIVREGESYRVVTRLSFAGRIVGERASDATPPIVIGKWEPEPAASSPALGSVPPRAIPTEGGRAMTSSASEAGASAPERSPVPRSPVWSSTGSGTSNGGTSDGGTADEPRRERKL
jgi:CBS domain-containing protein